MNRRGFFGLLSAGAAAVGVARLAPTPQAAIIYGDGKHDDTWALNEWGAGRPVTWNGRPLDHRLNDGRFKITGKITVTRRGYYEITRNYFDYQGPRQPLTAWTALFSA